VAPRHGPPHGPRHDARRRLARAALGVLGWLGGAGLAAPAHAQVTPVSLQLRPRVGDIIRTRLDQVVEVTGTTRHGGQDTTVTVRTDLLVLTHSRVERADEQGATILAVTDSVMLFTTGSADSWTDQTMRRLRGQRLRMRVAPDGAVAISGKAGAAERELQALVAQMPALLPRDPVLIGASWARAMGVPLAGQPEARLGAQVAATFRLDSLVGDLAWISLSGTLQPMKGADADALPTDLSGTVNGYVVVDRRRGWIVDARTMLHVRSTVPGTRDAPPMKFRMRIEQRLKAR
jgi:hypothetical protein